MFSVDAYLVPLTFDNFPEKTIRPLYADAVISVAEQT